MFQCTLQTHIKSGFPHPLGRQVIDGVQLFHGFLELIHRDQQGHNKIIRREYSLAEEDNAGAVISEDTWTDMVKPGMTIGLNIILRRGGIKAEACPRCSTLCTGTVLSGNRRRW